MNENLWRHRNNSKFILETDELCRSVVENTPDGITRWSKALKLVFANPAFAARVGAPVESLYGRNCLEIGQPLNVATLWMENLAKVFDTGKPIEYYSSCQTPRGLIHFHSTMVPENDEQGNVETVLVIARDVTDMRNARKTIDRSNELLQSVLDSTADVISVFEAVRGEMGEVIDFKYVATNARGIHFNGADPTGKLQSIVHPGMYKSGIFDQFKTVVETGRTVDFEVFYNFENIPQGWYRIKATKWGTDGLVALTEDISVKKKTETELLRLKDELAQRATDKYLSIFNSIDEGYHLTEVIFDKDGKVVNLSILEENPAAKKIFGESFAGRTIKEIQPRYEENRMQVWGEVVRTGTNQRLIRYSPIWKKWIDFHLVKYGGDNSNLVVSIFRDITEEENAQDAVRRSEQRLAKELADMKRLQVISSRLIVEDNLQEIYNEICSAACDFMHSTASSLQIYSPENKEFNLLAFTGFHPESAEFWQKVEAHSGRVCGVAVAENQRIVIPDVEAWEPVAGAKDIEAFRWSKIRAIQCTPLFTRSGQIVGMISTHWQRVHTPSEHEFRILDVLARMTADLLERRQKEAALLKSQERLAEELADSKRLQQISSRLIEQNNQQELFEEILNAAMDFMHSDMSSLQILSTEKNELLLLGEKGFAPESAKFWERVLITSNSTCGAALAQGRRVAIEDIESCEFMRGTEDLYYYRLSRVRAVQSTPLITRSGNIVGMMSTHWRKVYEPSEREFRLLDVLARQAADLLERKQKEDALRSSQERLAEDLSDMIKLQSFSTQLIRQDDLQGIYEKLLQAASAIMHSEMATMQLFVPEVDQLLLLAFKGLDPDVAKFWTWVKRGGQSACGVALERNKRIIIPDVEISEFIATEENREAHRLAGIRSAQATPLITRSGDVIGMISTLWSTVHEPMERELRLFDVLARQAADLLDRKQKEEALRNSQEKLAADLADTKQLQSISSQLIKEDNTSAIYEQLLNAAGVILRSEKACLQLLFPERDELLMLAFKGFEPEETKAFEWVKNGTPTSCGTALARNARVVVTDIESCEFMAGTPVLEAYRKSNVRSMQSTPLITRSGHIIGMITTHWETVHEPAERELNLLDILARQAADLLERKQREEKYLSQLQQEVHERTVELRESQDLLKNVAELIPDMISLQAYPARKVIYANREPYALNGFSVEDYLKMSIEDRHKLIHPDDLVSIKTYMEGIANLTDNDIAMIEFRAMSKAGDWIWLRMRSRVFERDEKGEVKSFINIMQNISTQKEAEIELRNSKDLLQNIAQTIPDMVSVQGYPARNIIYYNREPYSLSGLDAEELSKISVEERHKFVHPDDNSKLIEYIASLAGLSNEDIATTEYRVKSKLRDWIWLRTRGKVFERDEEGNVISFINVIQNITSEKEAEQAVIDLNTTLLAKNEDLETLNSELKTFNSIAAKDYKETIQILYTNLEYIVSNEGSKLSNASKANIRKAQGAIQRMKLLTEDINSYLALYDHQANASLIDPNQIVKDVLMRLRGKIEKAGALIEATDLPSLKADPLLFSLLMTNLIDNTIKFRAENPIIKINSAPPAKLNGAVAPAENGFYTVVSVSDNGIGIDEKSRDKIFELFYTAHDKTKYKGSGIGLATCKKIMTLHDGYIKAGTNREQGTVINCYFPVT